MLAWVQAIGLLISSAVTLIKFVKNIQDQTENKKDAKECLGDLCSVNPKELRPLREAIQNRLKQL